MNTHAHIAHGHIASGPGASETGVAAVDFLTGNGQYMPRVHCMVDAAGSPDWIWIWLLILLQVSIVAGYLKIFLFWRKAYLENDIRDRNRKLMDLAWVFLWCAVCGYLASIVMFFWPAYRLVAFCLMPLAFFTWRFALNLEPFRLSLSAKRLHRELQESLERRNDELERTVTERTLELERALVRADAANSAKSHFIANMSHEIRTPMNAIMGFTDLLDDDTSDASHRREHLATIRRNSEHLLSLINDILDLSKIESGKLDIETVPTSPIQVLTDVQLLFAARAGERGIDLRCNFSASLPEVVDIDPTRFRQIVSNLVSNAVKFTEQGSVTIAAEHDGRRLIVTVRDTGPGIDEAIQPNLFTAFTQADASTTRRHGGTGLGLKISRDLARLMNGDVTLQSQPGEGSAFSLTIDAPVNPIEVQPDTVTPPDPSVASLRDRHVLVVEDGDDNALLAIYCLERSGATVYRARNGIEALQILERGEPIDVVLMDMQMPIMDGYEATHRIREYGYTMPIVATTASVMDSDRERCMSAGCSAFVGKPFAREDLLDACWRVLDGADSVERDAA